MCQIILEIFLQLLRDMAHMGVWVECMAWISNEEEEEKKLSFSLQYSRVFEFLKCCPSEFRNGLQSFEVEIWIIK